MVILSGVILSGAGEDADGAAGRLLSMAMADSFLQRLGSFTGHDITGFNTYFFGCQVFCLGFVWKRQRRVMATDEDRWTQRGLRSQRSVPRPSETTDVVIFWLFSATLCG